MAIITNEVTQGATGVQKRIDPAAMRMLIDGQQSKQYKEPEKSAVREVFSNASDSISEKHKAIKILKGEAKEEDFYVRSDFDVSRDSNFFLGYYDLNYLDAENDTITITHKYNGTGNDVLTITDHGVGVGFVKHPETGKTRIEGILEIGYSTKRNTDSELGKWGIGAKSPLAIGSETGYLMETIHNGKRFLIRVFTYNYHSMIGKLNKNGGENPFVIFYEGQPDATIIYYEETTEKNRTTITMDTLPSQRNIFHKAVTSQLKYFDNLEFKIIENNTTTVVPTKVELLYDGENFCIPKATEYTKPHMILNRVDYGLVNYPSMEQNERVGNIAFKINPSTVEVDRSRENLIWGQKTRKAIENIHKKIEEEAEEALVATLDKENFAEWIESVFLFKGAKTLEGKGVIAELQRFLPELSISSEKVVTFKDGTIYESIFSMGTQFVEACPEGTYKSKGRTTAVLEELKEFLWYTGEQEIVKKNAASGVPILLHYVTLDDSKESISAGEKFSALLALRDKYGPAITSFIICPIIELNRETVGIRFFNEYIDAEFTTFVVDDFNEMSTKYKIKVSSNDVEARSREEVDKERRIKEAKEKAKYNRENRVVTYTYANKTNSFEQYSKPAVNVNVGNDGALRLFGRENKFCTDTEPEDTLLMNTLRRIVNKDVEAHYFLMTKTNAIDFPTEECMYVQNFFTKTYERKLDYGAISHALIAIAYFDEFRQLIDEVTPIGYTYFASKENNIFLRGIFSKIDTVDTYLKSTETQQNFVKSLVSVGSRNDVDLIVDFLIKVAVFGRFCFENITASDDFKASAYITIMELPEDTPLDSVPIGVEGFNYSPINEIRTILSSLVPLKPLYPELKYLHEKGLLSQCSTLLANSFEKLNYIK